MSDDDKQNELNEYVETKIKPYEIPTKLLEEWYRIGPEEKLTLELPRVAFDMLYVAIFNAYSSSGSLQQASVYSDIDDFERANSLIEEAASLTQEGVNALRHWQTVIMSLATNSGTGLEEAASDD